MFIDDTIEQCHSFGFTGGPMFNTRITQLRNFRERRNAEWDIARHSYTASYINIGRDGMKEVRRMFYVCRGKLHCFRFEDPVDHDAQDEQFGIGDGVTTVFYLSKASEADGVTYQRRVALPVNASVTVNGSASSPTINLDTGQVTFLAAPANASILRWSADSFDVKVRFDQDELPFSYDNKDALNGTVQLVEVLDE